MPLRNQCWPENVFYTILPKWRGAKKNSLVQEKIFYGAELQNQYWPNRVFLQFCQNGVPPKNSRQMSEKKRCGA